MNERRISCLTPFLPTLRGLHLNTGAMINLYPKDVNDDRSIIDWGAGGVLEMRERWGYVASFFKSFVGFDGLIFSTST